MILFFDFPGTWTTSQNRHFFTKWLFFCIVLFRFAFLWPQLAGLSRPGCFSEMFLENLVVRYLGKHEKGILDGPWTKWMVLKAISSTFKFQFAESPES